MEVIIDVNDFENEVSQASYIHQGLQPDLLQVQFVRLANSEGHVEIGQTNHPRCNNVPEAQPSFVVVGSISGLQRVTERQEAQAPANTEKPNTSHPIRANCLIEKDQLVKIANIKGIGRVDERSNFGVNLSAGLDKGRIDVFSRHSNMKSTPSLRACSNMLSFMPCRRI